MLHPHGAKGTGGGFGSAVKPDSFHRDHPDQEWLKSEAGNINSEQAVTAI